MNNPFEQQTQPRLDPFIELTNYYPTLDRSVFRRYCENHSTPKKRDGEFSWMTCPVCNAGSEGWGGMLFYQLVGVGIEKSGQLIYCPPHHHKLLISPYTDHS